MAQGKINRQKFLMNVDSQDYEKSIRHPERLSHPGGLCIILRP
jgi:hypothetical protein